MKGKTLGVIVLALTIGFGLGGGGCGKQVRASAKPGSIYTQQQYQTKKISGEIIDIDEDSFAVNNISNLGGGCNFEFENIRIKSNNGEIYKLINAGPTSYRVGDKVQDLDFEQLPNGKVSYWDLARPTWKYRYTAQYGSIEADGIIK